MSDWSKDWFKFNKILSSINLGEDESYDIYSRTMDDIVKGWIDATSSRTMVSRNSSGMVFSDEKSVTGQFKIKTALSMVKESYLNRNKNIIVFSDITEYDPDSLWLEPYLMKDVSQLEGAKREHLTRRILNEPLIGHTMNFPTLLVCFSLSIPASRFVNLRTIRFMKRYNERFKDEPFFEKRDGSYDFVNYDSLAPVRHLVLLNAALMEDSYRDIMGYSFGSKTKYVIFKSFLEIVQYIFDNPYVNTAKWKSMLSNAQLLFGCLSEDGEYVDWVHSERKGKVFLNEWNVSKIGNFKKDRPWFNSLLDSVKKDTEDMSVLGLGVTRELFIHMVDCKVEKDFFRIWNMLISISGISGFSRGQAHIGHKKQFDFEPPPEAKAPFPWEKALFDEGFAAVESAHNYYINGVQHSRLWNYEHYLDNFMFMHTGKSAGGEKAKADADLLINGRKMKKTFTFTDKKAIARMNVEKLLSFDELSRKYTYDDPGLVGTRYVKGGKAPRAIIMIRLGQFNALIPLMIILNEYQNDVGDPSQPIGTSADFTVGKESGSVLSDHALGCLASCKEHFLISAADFETFDASLKWDNFREPTKRGIIKAMNIWMQEKWGVDASAEVATYADVLDILWNDGTLYNVVFESPDFANGESVPVVLDMELSGESTTISTNNIGNRANFRIFLNQLDKTSFGREIALKKVMFQGDDSFAVWAVDPNNWDDDAHANFSNTFVNTAHSNGLGINADKTILTIRFYEYLKKRFFMGYNIPLDHVPIFDGERPNKALPPFVFIDGISSTAAVKSSRGSDPQTMTRLVMMMWNFRRVQKIVVKEGKKVTNMLYYIPFLSVMVPKKMGGAGLFPFSLAGGNNDLSIAIMANMEKYPKLRELLNVASNIIDVKVESVAKIVSKQLSRKSKFNSPEDPFGSGREFMKSRLKDDVKKAAFAAAGHLLKKGINVNKEYFYPNAYKHQIELDVSSNKKLVSLDFAEKNNLGFAMLKNAQRVLKGEIADKFDAKFGWLKFAKYYLQDSELPDAVLSITTPFPCLKGQYERLVRKFDVSSNAISGTLNLNKIFNVLRTAGRRDLTQEQVFSELAKPEIFISHDNIVNTLVAMGYALEASNKVANTIKSKMNFFLFAQNTSSSLEDAFIPVLRINPETMKKFVKYNNGDISYPMLRDLLNGASMGLIIAMTGLPDATNYGLNILIDGKTETEMLHWILGKEGFPNEYDFDSGQIPLMDWEKRWNQIMKEIEIV